MLFIIQADIFCLLWGLDRREKKSALEFKAARTL